MTYKVVQTAVSTVIQKISGYSSTNVVVDDYRTLNKGEMKVVILRRGPSTREDLTMGSPRTVQNEWTVNAELYIPFEDETKELADDIIVEAQKIVDEIDKWPQLDAASGVIDSRIEEVSEPEEWLLGRSRYWRQVITVGATEIVEVTLSE